MLLASSGIWLKLNALPHVIAICRVFLVFRKVRENFRATRALKTTFDGISVIFINVRGMLGFLMTFQDLFARCFKYTAVDTAMIIV